VRQGNALDAVRISLAANAEHGKRREPGDYRKAYGIACRYELVKPTDSDAVAALLRCSIQWARNLTADARELERAAQEAAFERGRDEGKTVREIAEDTGVHHSTVVRRLGAKGKTFDPHQPGRSEPNEHNEAPAHSPDPPADPYAATREVFTERGQRWHRALEALRLVNEQDRRLRDVQREIHQHRPRHRAGAAARARRP
jgi:hypothetical protein